VYSTMSEGVEADAAFRCTMLRCQNQEDGHGCIRLPFSKMSQTLLSRC